MAEYCLSYMLKEAQHHEILEKHKEINNGLLSLQNH